MSYPEFYFWPANASLSIRVWGDEAVVYNSRTAGTHLLPQSSALVLEALGKRHMSRDEIKNILGDALRSDDVGNHDIQLDAYTDQLIREFLAIELIEASCE